MICFQNSVSSGKPEMLTKEIWEGLIDSPKVKNICKQISELDPNAEGYNDRKNLLKRKLPVIIPHAAGFKNGKRISADAVPSGLAMLDVDHVENPRERFEALQREILIENRISLVAITASGKGLRIIGARAQGETIEAAQMRMAEALGIEEYDAVTKDLARASYVVPREYILWMDQTELFAEREWKDEPSLTEAASEETGESETETYRGIPYADIVDELMVQMGIAGGAEQGERNTSLFALANYMRYICDFNAEVLLRVLPAFGLTEQERKQVIASAIGRPRKSQIPLILQAAISMCEKEKEVACKEPLVPKASDMKLPQLPMLLKMLCRKLPLPYRPAMIIASLPVLGTLATRIRFEYLDRQEHSLSFFSCISAPAASGKSFIRKPIDLLLTPINEQDAIEREKEQAYKEKLRTSKNSKLQPEDPHACPRNNGVSISVAKLLQLLTYAEGKHLIGIGEEMDTLVKSERAGAWSQKSDIYRLAFDNAEYGQAYMSESSFNAHIKVYYNLLLTGTPNSMKRFFKDIENGLATRVCFAQLPDESFADIPEFTPYSEEEKTEIIRIARQLETEQGTIQCQEVATSIRRWLEEKRQQALKADSQAMDRFRRRAAVIGFRAGMLAYLLENRKSTKLVASFAEWVAEYVFRNQMELWGNQMEQAMNCSFEAQNERGAAASLLSMLPKEFTVNDLVKLRAHKGQSVSQSSINTLLSRWKKSRLVIKTGESLWKQIG